eukprot:TRINITY_DN5674_c0_g1_i1.p1 TRINITY_DN5674_c0_g1~~TRINITY_DN5674_c0_g1_i1.p1  ORF type:complete len:152 (-),score=18.41 TRINITY_DN5674_c0_g1_i1:323-712(-)
MSNSPDINKIGRSFAKYYYTTFDTECKKLATLYKDASILTHEGEKYTGSTAIIGKLTAYVSKLKKCVHAVKTLDVQPVKNLILVFVTGDVKLDDSSIAIKFSETFCLTPTDEKMKDFWISNDVFRLNYA